jgi:hypothetical protein
MNIPRGHLNCIISTPTDYIVGETVFHIIGNGSDGPTSPVITNSDGIATVYEWDRSKAFLILGNPSGSFNIEARRIHLRN